MRGSRRLAFLVIAAGATLAAMPAGAAAKGSGEDFQFRASLPNSNGYSMSIWAEGHHRVGVLAQKGDVLVEYTVKGRASSRRVDADFGVLGRVHIRLQVKPEDFSPAFFRAKACKPSDLSLYGGHFHGEVDFAGEPEVASAITRSGPVALVLHRGRRCWNTGRHGTAKPRQSNGEQEREGLRGVDVLAAEAKPEGRAISLSLIRFANPRDGTSLTLYHAAVGETVGRVRIIRSANESTPTRKEVLRLGKRGAEPETAAIALPPPFSGSASYSAEGGASVSWSGDLTVSLPGADVVPLTGAGFSAGLCRSFSRGDQGNCSGSLADLSPTVIGEIGR